jgi:thiamine transport system ATP-binding protein
VLNINNVCYRYAPSNALMRYQLSIREGEILALQGESGVGKTTLLYLIAGFYAPESGQILWQEASLTDLPVDQRPVSFLFQDHNLFEHISVWENLQLGFGQDQPPKEALREAAVHLKVEDQLNKMPSQLSGGQRQRIALIRTLLRPEPIILLDEPFAELDPSTRQLATRWTKDTAKQQGKTVMMVTHQKEDVESVADRSLYLRLDLV